MPILSLHTTKMSCCELLVDQKYVDYVGFIGGKSGETVVKKKLQNITLKFNLRFNSKEKVKTGIDQFQPKYFLRKMWVDKKLVNIRYLYKLHPKNCCIKYSLKEVIQQNTF